LPVILCERNLGGGCSRIGFLTFGPKRNEVIGEWRRLHNEELHDEYSLPKLFCNQIKKNEMGVACGTNGEEESCIQGFGREI
jgi:hypothetical protein